MKIKLGSYHCCMIQITAEKKNQPKWFILMMNGYYWVRDISNQNPADCTLYRRAFWTGHGKQRSLTHVERLYLTAYDETVIPQSIQRTRVSCLHPQVSLLSWKPRTELAETRRHYFITDPWIALRGWLKFYLLLIEVLTCVHLRANDKGEMYFRRLVPLR